MFAMDDHMKVIRFCYRRQRRLPCLPRGCQESLPQQSDRCALEEGASGRHWAKLPVATESFQARFPGSFLTGANQEMRNRQNPMKSRWWVTAEDRNCAPAGHACASLAPRTSLLKPCPPFFRRTQRGSLDEANLLDSSGGSRLRTGRLDGRGRVVTTV